MPLLQEAIDVCNQTPSCGCVQEDNSGIFVTVEGTSTHPLDFTWGFSWVHLFFLNIPNFF